MKLRVRKQLAIRAGQWYTDKLSEKFLNMHLTPATLARMEAELEWFRTQQLSLEPMNDIWRIPFKIRELPPDRGYGIEVYIDPEWVYNNLLFIDEQ